MAADRPLLGILLMLGFCVLAPAGDSIAKFLGGTIPLLQLGVVRFGFQALLLVPLVLLVPQRLVVSRRVVWLTLVRTILHVIGLGAMFSALRFLPLADAIAIAFVMPFIMLILGKFFLNEEIGARRLSACVVGFIGTLLVVQPSFASVGLPALLPLVVAVVFAFFMLVTRQIAKEVDPIALQGLSGGMAMPLLALIWLLAPIKDDMLVAMVWPSVQEFWLLVLIGTIGTTAHLLMTWSLRYAPSATLAPMQYLEIPFATLIGWLVFRDLPNGLAAIGIVITVAAGLYIIFREHQRARMIALAEV